MCGGKVLGFIKLPRLEKRKLVDINVVLRLRLLSGAILGNVVDWITLRGFGFSEAGERRPLRRGASSFMVTLLLRLTLVGAVAGAAEDRGVYFLHFPARCSPCGSRSVPWPGTSLDYILHCGLLVQALRCENLTQSGIDGGKHKE